MINEYSMDVVRSVINVVIFIAFFQRLKERISGDQIDKVLVS